MWGLKSAVGLILFASAQLAVAADQPPICADRPSKSTGTCTVPAGSWQIETGLIDWSHDRSGGISTDDTTIGSSLLKYGLSDRADVEIGISPLEIVRVASGASRERHSGFGDILVRVKYRLSSDGAPLQVALDPFVKLPTASHGLGNGKVEGGLLIPISVGLGKSGLTLSLDPELDLLADADGHGRHLATQQVINLGFQANDRLSISAEIWSAWDWDPSGTGRQVSADGSLAFLLTKDVQLDAGANFGLNRQTPDVEIYTGASIRF